MEPSFGDLGISPKLLEILEKLQFKVPTPIQAQAIPIGMEGKDVIGIAQTGTGKTLAFSLPMLQRIARSKQQGLVVLPTRELAFQVDEELQKIGKSFGLRTALLIGGAPMPKQLRQINMNPHIIIGTPGRINDHLEERKTLNLSRVGVLVLDEADRMLDMGFAPQIRRIMKHVPKQRQTMLFSATMPNEIRRMVNEYMDNPATVEVAQAGTVTDRVDQKMHILEKHQKNQLLEKLLTDYDGSVLVFSRTKYGAKKICRAIRSMGHEAAELHSNLTLPQRRRSMEGFKSGKHRILVATDIASRGIDVNNIELVVNYDLPDNPEDYVHRVGRTGRAGKMGQAISFATPEQKREVNDIEASVQQRIAIAPLPELPPARQGGGHDSYRTEQSNYGNRRRTNFKYARAPRSKQPRRSQSRQRTSSSGYKTRVHV
ncbi:hypothetical protein CL628_04605 [bacterium]|nr:hypothetical protein [bacterium]